MLRWENSGSSRGVWNNSNRLMDGNKKQSDPTNILGGRHNFFMKLNTGGRREGKSADHSGKFAAALTVRQAISQA